MQVLGDHKQQMQTDTIEYIPTSGVDRKLKGKKKGAGLLPYCWNTKGQYMFRANKRQPDSQYWETLFIYTCTRCFHNPECIKSYLKFVLGHNLCPPPMKDSIFRK